MKRLLSFLIILIFITSCTKNYHENIKKETINEIPQLNDSKIKEEKRIGIYDKTVEVCINNQDLIKQVYDSCSDITIDKTTKKFLEDVSIINCGIDKNKSIEDYDGIKKLWINVSEQVTYWINYCNRMKEAYNEALKSCKEAQEAANQLIEYCGMKDGAQETVTVAKEYLKTGCELYKYSTIEFYDKVDDKSKEIINKVPSSIESCKRLYNFGDEVIAGDFKWNISNPTKASQIGESFSGILMGVKANGEFLIFDVEVENIGNSAQLLSDSFVKLVDDKNREFSAHPSAAIFLKPQGSSLTFETLNPGIIKKGKIVFDVPKDLKIVNIRISSNLLECSFYNIKLII